MPRMWKAKVPGDASYSTCTRYRWWLTRELGGKRPLVAIGLNPSKATEEWDDPTVAKEQLFAKLWGFDRYIKLNAYGWRETKPKIMFAAQKRGVDIVGADNDRQIRLAVLAAKKKGGRVFVSWGENIEPERQQALYDLVSPIMPMWCTRTNKSGSPKHSLYEPNESTLQEWHAP